MQKIYIMENATAEDLENIINIQDAQELTAELHRKMARAANEVLANNSNLKVQGVALTNAIAGLIMNIEGYQIEIANHVRDYVIEWMEKAKDIDNEE